MGRLPRSGPRVGRGIDVNDALTAREQTVGALNLYATQAHAFNQEPVRAAAAQLVTLITMAITATLRNYGDVTVTDQLQHALSSRSVIDQAIGVLVGTQRCTPDEVLRILLAASQTRNIRLHQVAQDLVDRSAHPITN